MDSNLESKVTTLLEKIDKIEKERKHQSEDVKDIIPALIKAQGEFGRVGAFNKGVYGKYATLSDIWDKVGDPLLKNDLFLTQFEDVTFGHPPVLVTRIYHKSGQWIESRHALRPKAELKDPTMDYGKQLTYFKRYALVGLLGVFVDRDMVEEEEQQYKQQEKPKTSHFMQKPDAILKEEAVTINNALIGYPNIRTALLKAYNINTVEDLPRQHFIEAMDRIKKIRDLTKVVENESIK